MSNELIDLNQSYRTRQGFEVIDIKYFENNPTYMQLIILVRDFKGIVFCYSFHQNGKRSLHCDSPGDLVPLWIQVKKWFVISHLGKTGKTIASDAFDSAEAANNAAALMPDHVAIISAEFEVYNDS